jgi:hypothetical protein
LRTTDIGLKLNQNAMRAWLHILITLLLTVVSTTTAIFLALVVGFRFDHYLLTHELPRWWAWAVWLLPFVGLQAAGIVMGWIPCVCPRCGARARLRMASALFRRVPVVRAMGGRWAWLCRHCGWSSFQWSSLYRLRR